MTTLTVKISDKKHAKMLYEMLNSMDFVKEVDIEEDLSNEEIKMLEERLVDYKKNPKSGVALDTVVKNISKKYGFKNNS
jgi:hypothetical protein